MNLLLFLLHFSLHGFSKHVSDPQENNFYLKINNQNINLFMFKSFYKDVKAEKDFFIVQQIKKVVEKTLQDEKKFFLIQSHWIRDVDTSEALSTFKLFFKINKINLVALEKKLYELYEAFLKKVLLIYPSSNKKIDEFFTCIAHSITDDKYNSQIDVELNFDNKIDIDNDMLMEFAHIIATILDGWKSKGKVDKCFQFVFEDNNEIIPEALLKAMNGANDLETNIFYNERLIDLSEMSQFFIVSDVLVSNSIRFMQEKIRRQIYLKNKFLWIDYQKFNDRDAFLEIQAFFETNTLPIIIVNDKAKFDETKKLTEIKKHDLYDLLVVIVKQNIASIKKIENDTIYIDCGIDYSLEKEIKIDQGLIDQSITAVGKIVRTICYEDVFDKKYKIIFTCTNGTLKMKQSSLKITNEQLNQINELGEEQKKLCEEQKKLNWKRLFTQYSLLNRGGCFLIFCVLFLYFQMKIDRVNNVSK